MGASSLRSVDKVDRERDTDSTDAPSYYSGPIPTSEKRDQDQEPPKERKGKGHYRGITFEDILPPDLIANAPPPGVDQKRERPKSAQLPSTSSSPSTTTTAERRSSTSTKRSYPPMKQHSGGKSRFHATARAIVRRLTVSKPKQDSRRRSGGYEAV